MDGKSFDRWTRTRALSTNRRSLLGVSLSAGIATALARVLPAAAQFDGAAGGSCTYDVTLTSSVTVGAIVTGELVIDVGQEGAIDSGSLTLEGQQAASVVGQATGRAVDLHVALTDGTRLALSGVASEDIATCSAEIRGLLANADNGQLGTWIAQPTGSAQAPTPTPASSESSGSQSSSSSSGSGSNGNTGGGSGSGNPCPSPQFACGPSCCPAGASCTDSAQGICSCPGGTIQCGSTCVADCTGDEFLNLDTCECEGVQEPACVDLGGVCGFSGQCCSGWCNAGSCDSCGMRVCNDMCVDTTTDNNNCGNCNKMCIGTTCQNGSCQ